MLNQWNNRGRGDGMFSNKKKVTFRNFTGYVYDIESETFAPDVSFSLFIDL